MEENNLISAPQAVGFAGIDLFTLMTKPTVEREQFLAAHNPELRDGVGGVCPTIVKN